MNNICLLQRKQEGLILHTIKLFFTRNNWD